MLSLQSPRAHAPDQSRGCTLLSRTRGDTTESHGPLQRLLDGALLTWRLVRRRCGRSARGIRPVRSSADAGHVHALIDSNTCQILRYKQQQISFSTTQVQPGGRTVVNFKSVGSQHRAAHRVAGSVSAVVTVSYRTRWPYLPPVVEAWAYVHPHSKVARRQRPSRLRRRMTGAPENHGSRESARESNGVRSQSEHCVSLSSRLTSKLSGRTMPHAARRKRKIIPHASGAPPPTRQGPLERVVRRQAHCFDAPQVPH
jgi:hypothetical protein